MYTQMNRKTGMIIRIVVLTELLLSLFFYFFPVNLTDAGTSCTSGNRIKLLDATSNPAGFLAVGTDRSVGKYTTPSKCLTGDEAKIKILPPDTNSFDNILARYYTQAKITNQVEKHPNQTTNSIPLDGSKDHLYHITTDLSLSGAPAGSKTGVVFVDGNLSFDGNFTRDNAGYGTVFIVKNNVFVQKAVTRIDAFIVTYGRFCSAASGSTCDTGNTLLNLYGGLISLNDQPNNQPVFSRTNPTSGQPGEKVTFEPKYLVILKDVFAREEINWKELQ